MLPACIFGKHFFVYAKGLSMALFPLLFIIFYFQQKYGNSRGKPFATHGRCLIDAAGGRWSPASAGRR